jgi:hypothetical protein
VDAGVGQLLFGLVVTHGVGEKQATVGHGRVGKIGFAVMLKGWRCVALVGKGERRLLRERDAAAGALSTHDPANDDNNKQIDDNAKFPRPGVVALEVLGRLAAQAAKRRGASNFVSSNSVGIGFDYFFCMRLVGRCHRHETSPPETFCFTHLALPIDNGSYIKISRCCNCLILIETKNETRGGRGILKSGRDGGVVWVVMME